MVHITNSRCLTDYSFGCPNKGGGPATQFLVRYQLGAGAPASTAVSKKKTVDGILGSLIEIVRHNPPRDINSKELCNRVRELMLWARDNIRLNKAEFSRGLLERIEGIRSSLSQFNSNARVVEGVITWNGEYVADFSDLAKRFAKTERFTMRPNQLFEEMQDLLNDLQPNHASPAIPLEGELARGELVRDELAMPAEDAEVDLPADVKDFLRFQLYRDQIESARRIQAAERNVEAREHEVMLVERENIHLTQQFRADIERERQVHQLVTQELRQDIALGHALNQETGNLLNTYNQALRGDLAETHEALRHSQEETRQCQQEIFSLYAQIQKALADNAAIRDEIDGAFLIL